MTSNVRRALLFSALVSVVAPVAFAATFVVPQDREMVRRAHAIVVATPLTSYSQPTDEGGIETVTPLRIEQVIKGRNLIGDTVRVVEPGGEYGGRAMLVSGVPRFDDTTRVLLFLTRTGSDRWAVSELVLGKFTFRMAGKQQLLMRDADDIVGWDPDLKPHQEHARDAARFLDFVKNESSGVSGADDYFVSDSVAATATAAAPTRSAAPVRSLSLQQPAIQPLVAPYSATSYTMVISGTSGARWAVFPSAVTFYSGTTQEPGAPGGGSTAITAAFTAWNNDCGSNVNYVYGGTDNGTHTQGLHGPDGANTVLFERDLSAWGIAPFTCSGSGYSGTLGIGGITTASGTNTVNGESFATTQEADVEMNRGLANCSVLFNNGDFNSGVTHEVGHTLGFRHSDQNRSSSAACSTDASLECSDLAIMKSFVSTGLNATLQTWDQHAVQAVYPGNVCAPGSSSTPPPPTNCTPPSITSQPSSVTITYGSSTTLTVGASGTATLGYQWYVGTSGDTSRPVAGANGPSITTGPAQTTSYWVRVTNSCGAVNSNTATITVTQPPASCTPPTITGQPGSPTINAGSSATLNVTASGTAPLSYQWYVGTSGNTAGAISGATGPSLTVSPASTTNYWVRVSNSCGSANSNTATVTVAAAAPRLSLQRNKPDFNGDGKADILWRNTSTGSNYMYLMNGMSIASYGQINVVSDQAWQIVGTGDFNGDGMWDILWRNMSTGANYVYLMNGMTIIASATINTVADQNWKVVGTGDFDGDGKSDILWRNTATGSNYIYLMNGTAFKGFGEINVVADQSWTIAGTGDFDGDGKTDILWHRTTTGENYVYLMNGLNIVASGSVNVLPTSWTVAGTGDFDGDGKSDFLMRNSTTGELVVYFMNGLTVRASASINTVATVWTVVGTGDYDGDGKSDILWRNTSTGEVYMYLMNGAAIRSYGSVNTVDPSWKIVQ